MYSLIRLLLVDYSKEELAEKLKVTKNRITRWRRSDEGMPSGSFVQAIQNFADNNKNRWLAHLAQGDISQRIRGDLRNITIFDIEWLFEADKVVLVGNMWLLTFHGGQHITYEIIEALKNKGASCPKIICILSGPGANGIAEEFLDHVRIHLKHFQVDRSLMEEKLVILKTPEIILMSPSAFIGVKDKGWLEGKSIFTGKKNQLTLIPTNWAFTEFQHGYLALIDKGKLKTMYGKEGFVDLSI